MWHIVLAPDTQFFPYSLPGLLLLFAAFRRPWSTAYIISGIRIIAGALPSDTGLISPYYHGVFLLVGILLTILFRSHWACTCYSA